MSATDDPKESFLNRWSRRKRSGEQHNSLEEEVLSTGSTVTEIHQGSDSVVASEASAREKELEANREAAEAVDLESLTFESDFTVFMKSGVPSALKNAALRKLWRSNPVLAVLDGLNDYDEDFRNVQTFADGIESAWKVGKGYADKAEQVHAEMEEKSRLLQLEREEEAAARTRLDENADVTPEANLDAETASGEVEVADMKSQSQPDLDPSSDLSAEEAAPPKVPLRRRMEWS